MANSELDRAFSATWTLRLFSLIPLPPIAIGLLIGALVFSLYLLYTLQFGPSIGVLQPGDGQNLWGAELILALLIGFAPTVTAYSLMGTARDLDDLRPTLALSHDEYAETRRVVLGFSRSQLRVTGWTVAILTALFVSLDSDIWASGRRPTVGDPAFSWVVLRNAANAWFVARAIHMEIALARSFSRVGEHLSTIDLLDQSALAPFGRHGLRSVLLWMLFVAFYSLLYTGNWAADYLGLVLIAIALYAVAGFLLPVVGAHRRIREAKRLELAHVRRAVRTARDRLLESDTPTHGGQLADLVSYEARVAGVREWPFDATTLLRWAFYVTLGLGSWLGGAVVERLLDFAL